MTEEVPVLGWLADPITSRPVLQYLKQFDRRIWIFQAGQVTSITMQHEVLNEVGLLYYFQYLGTLSGGLRFFFQTGIETIIHMISKHISYLNLQTFLNELLQQQHYSHTFVACNHSPLGPEEFFATYASPNLVDSWVIDPFCIGMSTRMSEASSLYIYISYEVTLLYWNIDEFKVDCVKNVWTSQMFHFFRGFQRSHGLGHGGCWNERAASRPLGSWKMPSLESRAEHLPSSKLTLTMENHHVWYEIHLQMVFCVFSDRKSVV